MILTCPGCSTRFLIPAQALAPEGRRVKCSRCSEEWFQEPDPDELLSDIEAQIEDIPESVKPVPEGSSVPAIRKDEDEVDEGSGVPMGLAAATAVFVVILAALVFMKGPIAQQWPPSIAFYNMIGMNVVMPGQGLEFDRVEAGMADGVLKVSGHIINLKSQPADIPVIEATIKNSHGDGLAKWYMDPPKASLPAEESIAFQAEYKGALKGAESLHVRFVMKKRGAAKEVAPAPDKHEASAHDNHHDDGHH